MASRYTPYNVRSLGIGRNQIVDPPRAETHMTIIEHPVTGPDDPVSLDRQLENWASLIERGLADMEDLPWIAKKLREAAVAIRSGR